MAPGFTAMIGGRPKPSPIFKLLPEAKNKRSELDVEISFSDDDFSKKFKFLENCGNNEDFVQTNQKSSENSGTQHSHTDANDYSLGPGCQGLVISNE